MSLSAAPAEPSPPAARQGEAAALADLRWLLLSPALLHDQGWPAPLSHQRWAPGQEAVVRAWLDRLPQDPAWQAWWAAWQPPADASQPSPWDRMRLGRRAEALLGFYLRHGPLHRLMDQHRPLRVWDESSQEIRTLGEIDFLLVDSPHASPAPDAAAAAERSGPLSSTPASTLASTFAPARAIPSANPHATASGWHWELAVKFYLCLRTQGQAQAADYWGPDLEEHFPVKLDKLLTHQLRQGPAVPWREGVFLPQALTRGCMFHAWDRPVTPWEGLAPGHGQGFWLALEEGDVSEEGARLPAGGWALLDRRTWLGGAGTEGLPATGAFEPQPWSELLRQLRALWASPAPRGARHWPSGQMAVGPHPDGQGGRCRWFFLPPGWQARAQARLTAGG